MPLDLLGSYASFIGYPRSGHSLVGAMLSAHPDAVVSHELGALEYVRAGCNREQLFKLIEERDRSYLERGASSNDYDYAIPSGWQGRTRTLRVIGDKQGGRTSKQLIDDLTALDRLEEVVGVPVGYVHLVRNPYDNIATMATRARSGVDRHINRFFRLASVARDVQLRTDPRRWFEWRLEDLIQEPLPFLEALAEFHGLTPEPAWVDACVGAIFDRPTRSRDRVTWSAQELETIRERIADYRHFAGYAFEA